MKRTCGFLLALVCLLPALAVQAMPEIQHWQTAGGARVYFVPAPELPMVDINVTFAAGSARDNGQAGVAHMTSILLDKGAAGLDANTIAERVEALGAKLSTGSERDMASVELRSLSDPAHLEPALRIFTDVLARPDFNKEDFERERARTLVAIQQSEQSPSTVAENAFYLSLYGEHPYASRPEGTEEGLRALTRAQVREFYRRYYVAKNAVIGIVGDVDRKAAEAIAEQLTAGLQPGKRAAPLPPAQPLRQASQEHIFHPSAQTTIYLGAPGMHRGDPDYFVLYVGNHILGGSGLVSRLSEEVREKRGLSYSVYSYFTPMEQDGPYQFALQTRNDQVDEALAVMRETLDKYLKEGPSEDELEAAKKNITGGFALRIDSNSKILDYLVVIGFYDLPLDYLQVFNDRIMAVTREQIIDAYRRRVLPDAMSTIIVGGNGGGSSG